MATKKSNVEIWLPLYVGDFYRDTAGMSDAEVACYIRLKVFYWDRGPLPADTEPVLRLIGNESALRSVLNQFFILEADGFWHNPRWDELKADAIEYERKAREHAMRGVEARRAKRAILGYPPEQ